MPSKKKQSKTPSRLSNSEASASPRTPASSTSCPNAESIDKEELRRRLKEASAWFPCLIGESAVIGIVNDFASESIRGFKIWLPETSMVAASITPGSIVSVSLASSVRRFSNSFPLSSITGEYGIDSGSSIINEPGNFFVLATVFSSSKVLKDAVRISLNLHYGLGCPVSGRTVFVYPVHTPFLTDTVKGRDQSYNTDVNRLSLLVCKELYLELTSLRNTLGAKCDLFSMKKFATESSQRSFENGNSTPKTPVHVQKFSSHGSNLSASPIISGSVSTISKQQFSPISVLDMQEVLTNESTRKLLQTCATSWLYPCNLLYGNLVAIPILSEICIFCVKGANRLPTDGLKQNATTQTLQSVHIQALETANLANYAFMINQDTKVCFHQPLDSASEITVEKTVRCLQLDPKDQGESTGREFPKLGGLSKESAVLKDIIVSSSMENALSSLGLRPTKGVLLHGPPGTGKTTLACSCAHDSGVSFFSLNGPEIVSQYFGESEKALHEIFSSASKAPPSVVFIDELDAIAPARKEGSEELSQRMVATLLNLMDGISRSEGVTVIAATNRPDSIEPALRRPGRLDREIEIGVPSPGQRFDILLALLDGMQHSLSDVQVQQLAMATHGFVGADLAALCNEAALFCLRRHYNERGSSAKLHPEEAPVGNCKPKSSDSPTSLAGLSTDSSDTASSSITDLATAAGTQPSRPISQVADDIPNSGSFSSEKIFLGEEEHTLSVAFEDFEIAKLKIRPSAMREVILEVPKVNWDDVGGQKEVKSQLMEAVEWPQKHHDAFKRIGTRPPTGILMFGPPGCSKTLMARAVASEAGLNFLAVKGPELFSKWVGESEKAVRSLFAKARANAPSIIFFDEIDGLAISRGKESDGISVSDRVMSQLLVELDGLHERVDVTVIAATNRPDKIDPALLRPGRFDRLLYVGPPNKADREEIFRIHLRKIPCCSDISLKELASLTEGCTGADISWICREAALVAMQESLEIKEITMQHLKAAIIQVEPTDVQSYKELSTKFQRLVHSNAQGDEVEHPESINRRSCLPLWMQIKSMVTFFHRLITS